MDALVMAGGRGSRLDAEVEKPLLEVGGRPMIDRVVDVIGSAAVDETYVAVSPHVPATRSLLADRPVTVIETAGEGYVADLDAAVEAVGTPVLTVAADLPLLAPDVVDRVMAGHEGGSLTVCVPAALKRLLGASLDRTIEGGGRELAPTGLNVVGEGDRDATHVSHDVRLAVNVNRPSDARLAAALLESAAGVPAPVDREREP